jgi:septal ring factor EnvC (AmiA/AmiB activator)
MFFLSKLQALKAVWPTLLVIVLIVVALVVLSALSIRGCGSSAEPDYLGDAKKAILEQVDTERAANLERMKALEAEIYDLREQIETLDAEVKESAIEREEIHDAIDNAASIDAVDRILRGGIKGVSGRNP